MPYKDVNKRIEANRKYRERNRDVIRVRNRQYWIDNPEIRKKQVEIRKSLYHEQKKVLFDYYGWSCNCCGETMPKFLSIDHVNNDGYLDKELGISRYKKILKEIEEGLADKYQVLCHNCNTGKKLNGGICPHKDIGGK